MKPDTPTRPSSSAATLPGKAPPRRMRLGAVPRKVWLIVHIAAAGAWLGMDLVLGVLVVTALVSTDPQTVSVASQAIELFAVWPVLTAGLVCLVSGVVLGLGTKYGLVRYWWVAVKLVMNVVLVLLVLFALRPGVREAAELGRTLGQHVAGDMPSGMLFPPVVSTAAVLFATVISVLKPWGRIGKDNA